MLEECLEVFQKELERKTEKGISKERWLLDNYIPKSGIYVLINMEKNFALEKVLRIKRDKKNDKKTGEVKEKTAPDNSYILDPYYRYILYLDYCSMWISSNKPIAEKQIHSNNAYAFFVKKENIGNQLDEKCIDEYYSFFKNPYKKKYSKSKPKGRQIYQQIEKSIGPVDVSEVEKIYQWIKEEWREFSIGYESELKPKSDKNAYDYLKIFFVKSNRKDTQDLFKREGERYLYPNLFNKNDYNEMVGEKIKGLPYPNMCMDESNKPYLDNKTRKHNMPYMLDIETAYLWKQFFDYLEGQAARHNNNIYINLQDETILAYSDNDEKNHMLDEGIYLRVQRIDRELQIEYITRICRHHQKLLSRFEMKEVLKISTKKKRYTAQFGNKHELGEVENLFDEVFFEKKLKKGYFGKKKDIKKNTVKRILLTYGRRLWMVFHAGEFAHIEFITNKIALQFIMDSIRTGDTDKAKQQFNLWISTIDYVRRDGRFEEEMMSVREEFKKHMLCTEEWEFSGPEEYYYAIGQLAGWFLRLKETSKKNKYMSFVNLIMKTQNDEVIKERLTTLFEKYNYKLTYDSVQFRKLYAHILGYPYETQVDKKYIAYGFVDDNLVDVKKDETAAED